MEQFDHQQWFKGPVHFSDIHGRKRTKSDGALLNDNNSVVTEDSTTNNLLNIGDNLALAGALSRSPSLRRISLKNEEPPKRVRNTRAVIQYTLIWQKSLLFSEIPSQKVCWCSQNSVYLQERWSWWRSSQWQWWWYFSTVFNSSKAKCGAILGQLWHC